MSYIKREAIHKMLDEMLDINIGVGAMMSEQCVRELIEDTPAADVVEVVRCKDCKHGQNCPRLGVICEYQQDKIQPYRHFCSSGERGHWGE